MTVLKSNEVFKFNCFGIFHHCEGDYIHDLNVTFISPIIHPSLLVDKCQLPSYIMVNFLRHLVMGHI